MLVVQPLHHHHLDQGQWGSSCVCSDLANAPLLDAWYVHSIAEYIKLSENIAAPTIQTGYAMAPA